MKKILFTLCSCTLLCAICPGAEIIFNGGFEDATATKTGILWPRYWYRTPLSKQTHVRLTKEPTEIRTGKFALFIEQEEKKSVANVRYLKSYPAAAKDKVSITLYARGTGKLHMMVILYHGEKGKFLRTIGLGKIQKIDSPDKWVKLEYSRVLPVLKDRTNPILKLKFLPVIHSTGEAELLIDDIKMFVTPAGGK